MSQEVTSMEAVDVAALPEDVRQVEMFVRAPEEFAFDGEGFMGGWWAVRVAGDVVTQVACRLDGDLSLLRRYDSVDFLSVIRAGEYFRFTGKLVRVGKTSRTIEVAGYRVIARGKGFEADTVDPPQLVFRATGVIVVPVDSQSKSWD